MPNKRGVANKGIGDHHLGGGQVQCWGARGAGSGLAGHVIPMKGETVFVWGLVSNIETAPTQARYIEEINCKEWLLDFWRMFTFCSIIYFSQNLDTKQATFFEAKRVQKTSSTSRVHHPIPLTRGSRGSPNQALGGKLHATMEAHLLLPPFLLKRHVS